jgi:diguanylate cyclase (GGDEF)-like protein
LLPILNRRAFVREIARFIAFVERYGTPASLLYLDLDGFKAVNDTHGHAAGDAVLHHFAALLAAHVRGTDVVGRLGGDEFAVVLAHASLEQARIKGESLCRALNNNPLRWQGKPVAVSCSYGTHELRAGENADAAMASADLAMYAHKRERV